MYKHFWVIEIDCSNLDFEYKKNWFKSNDCFWCWKALVFATGIRNKKEKSTKARLHSLKAIPPVEMNYNYTMTQNSRCGIEPSHPSLTGRKRVTTTIAVSEETHTLLCLIGSITNRWQLRSFYNYIRIGHTYIFVLVWPLALAYTL